MRGLALVFSSGSVSCSDSWSPKNSSRGEEWAARKDERAAESLERGAFFGSKEDNGEAEDDEDDEDDEEDDESDSV